MRLRPFLARDPHEPHRVSTQLELLFDLVCVVAVAAVTETLHHAISAGHGPSMLVNFLLLFAVIWWAWMNYTWFASAFDNGDGLFIALTMVVMCGFAIFAGGVSAVTETMDFGFALAGWIVMRVGMIALWLRAAWSNADYRGTALAYAAGIALAQMLWVALYFTVPAGSGLFLPLYVAIFVVEIAVPVLAEQLRETPWHRHHLIERYGLLNIIVMGEVVVSVSLVFGQLYEGHFDPAMLVLALSGLVVVFGLWWSYFAETEHLATPEFGRALVWGYGHVVIFGAGTMIASGLGAAMDALDGHSEITPAVASAWVNLPAAVYLAGLWFVRDRFLQGFLRGWVLLVAAAILAMMGGLGAPVWATALVVAGAATLRVEAAER